MCMRILIRYIYSMLLNIGDRLHHFKILVWLWFLNVEHGQKVRIYGKLYLRGHGKVKIGDDFVFTSGDAINPISRNIRGILYTMTPNSMIEIGDRVGISSACIWAKTLVRIGNDVNIGGDCIIIDNDAHPVDFRKRRRSYEQKKGLDRYIEEDIPSIPVYIDDDVWIGARCQILKGVHIGARSIIGAGSVVTSSIPSDVVAGGNPCRVIRKL